ncbi:MAG: S8 family serine peptidase [Solirubrobacteraceae bacterium]|nr:S8 family serine peptidase [Solirubrobacteraceae bacterium]
MSRALIVAAVVILAAPAAAHGSPLVVGYHDHVSASQRADVASDAAVDRARRLESVNADVVTTDDPDEAIAELSDDQRVAFVEPDAVMAPVMTADGQPTLYSAGAPWGMYQWPLNPAVQLDADAHIRVVGADGVWARTLGEGVVVGAVDSGVAGTGESAFAASLPRYWPEQNVEPPGGWTSAIVASRDLIEAGDGRTDPRGHGTAVIGTILGREGAPTIGVAPAAQGVSVRVFGATGGATTSVLAEGLQAAVDDGARIVNGSFGGLGSSAVLEAVVQANPDVLFVFASGNDGADAAMFSPCNIPLGNVLCVSSVDGTGTMSSFANSSTTAVDLAAPGDAIVAAGRRVVAPGVTWPFEHLSGTSLAAPHVSGVAALLLSRHPDATPQQLRQAIMDGATVDPASGPSVTGGYLNATETMHRLDTMLGGPVPRLDAPVGPAAGPGGAITVTGSNLRDIDAVQVGGEAATIKAGVSYGSATVQLPCTVSAGTAALRVRDGTNWSTPVSMTVGTTRAPACPVEPSPADPGPAPPSAEPAPAEPARSPAPSRGPVAAPVPGAPSAEEPPADTSRRRLSVAVSSQRSLTQSLWVTSDGPATATMRLTRLSCSARCKTRARVTRRVRLRKGTSTVKLTPKVLGMRLAAGRWRVRLAIGSQVATATIRVR